MRKYLLLILIFKLTNSFSQEFGLQTGYANIGKNYGYLGLDARLTDKSHLNIGLGSYATLQSEKLVFLPEIHINFIPFNNVSSIFKNMLMIEISATDKFVNPSLGINVLNFLKIKSGYSIPFQHKESFQGITFGINFSFGTKEYTDGLKTM